MPPEERLESHELFSFLRPDQVNAISEVAKVVRFRAGDTVYSQGERADHIYVVLEGEVLLRLPGKGGVSIPIDQVVAGVMFGACKCFETETYSTTAQCTQDSRIMKFEALVFDRLLEDDMRMGYAMQRRMAGVYFKRYLETMRKLQSIVMNLPVEVA
jgi:CRP-like cAMP-binding protein